MPWLPDHMWEKQKQQRQQGKGTGKGWQQADVLAAMQNADVLGLLQLMGGIMDEEWTGSWGSGGGWGSSGAEVSDDQVNWKGELQTAYAKSQKKSGAQSDIKYTFVEEDGPNFKAAVSIAGKTFTGDKVLGKKKAEASAAKKALRAMFRNHDLSHAYEVAASQATQGIPASSGTKRKHAETQQEQPPKCRLMHAMQLILGRSATKEDIVFNVEQADGGFVATVSINASGSVFMGEPQKSKKEAESVAAEVALASLSDQIKVIEAAHQEKKKQKNKEATEARKAMLQQKKEERRAAAAVAAEK